MVVAGRESGQPETGDAATDQPWARRVLERAREGDHVAFRDLVRHYDPGLRSLAFSLLGDAGRMDDVLQDAYVKAFRGLGTFRAESSVRTWMYRITYNACLDDLRRRSQSRG